MKSARCSAAGEKAWIIPKRKTAPFERGKKTLSETEHELVVGIPLVARIRPIVVQPQAVVVAFHIEDVRVAIAVGSVRHAIRTTARLKGGRAVFYA